MLEPATIALHVIRRANLDLNDSIVIIGAGPIGLMAARWATIYGAQKVMLIDVDSKKSSSAANWDSNMCASPLKRMRLSGC